MQLQDFVGKTVVNTVTSKRFSLYKITSPEIVVVTLEPDAQGHHTFYAFPTINGDPFATGRLVFENPSLAKPFRNIYDAYCHSQDAYWEDYGYWMRRD